MKAKDVDSFFSKLDNELSQLSVKRKEKKLKEDFPKYHHIGPFVGPESEDARKRIQEAIKNDLKGYSFDPLLSFPMQQQKYSIEVLHPDCNCFRRAKVKKRPIKNCSHRDRLLYACWNHYLTKHYKNWLIENELIDAVSAYIPETGKFNADFAKLAFDYLQGRNEYSAVALDVKSFFDVIPHNILRENVLEIVGREGKLLEVDHRMLKAVIGYVSCEKDVLLKHQKDMDSAPGMVITRKSDNWKYLRSKKLLQRNSGEGIPQGLACSGVLANIVMMSFDKKMFLLAQKNDSVFIRYADDIFIASPNLAIRKMLEDEAKAYLKIMELPIAEKKTEEFDFLIDKTTHPVISYLGLTCQGNEVSVRNNGVNKFYQRTSRFIHSYVSTCRRREKTPSRSKIRGIFSHTGNRNYYSYLRRASKIFEEDSRYRIRGIKGVLKGHAKWLDKQFEKAFKSKLADYPNKYKSKDFCTCPLMKDSFSK